MPQTLQSRYPLPEFARKSMETIAWYLPHLPELTTRRFLRTLATLTSRIPNASYIGVNAFASTLDLTPELVLANACFGAFPRGKSGGKRISWRTPHIRAVLALEDFKTSRRMRSFIKKSQLEVTMDTDFRGVMQQCANRETTWLTPEVMEVYYELHKLGYSHSVEVRQDGKLVAGNFGMALGSDIYTGNSQFHHLPNTGMVGAIYLVEALRASNFKLLDCQLPTKHWESLGAKEISREEYQQLIMKSVMQPSELKVMQPDFVTAAKASD